MHRNRSWVIGLAWALAALHLVAPGAKLLDQHGFAAVLTDYRIASAARHDLERGAGSFEQAMRGLKWLSGEEFVVNVAARSGFDEADETAMRRGFAQLFETRGIAIDPVALMLSPEMDAERDVPEISSACWSILDKRPAEMMCASSRMVVKRRGALGRRLHPAAARPRLREGRDARAVLADGPTQPFALHPLLRAGWCGLLAMKGERLQFIMALGGGVFGLVGVAGALADEGPAPDWVMRLFVAWCATTPYW